MRQVWRAGLIPSITRGPPPERRRIPTLPQSEGWGRLVLGRLVRRDVPTPILTAAHRYESNLRRATPSA